MISITADLARNILDAAPDAMIIVDDRGQIKFTNRQVAVLFGYDHDTIIGLDIETLLPERFRARHISHREHYVNEGRVRPMGVGLSLYGRRRDGSEFPVEISLSPISGGDRPLIAAAIRDATERKRTEADLIAAREAAEAARLLAVQAQEIADRANQGKSRFLATASHDLRQPLQTLALLNGALRRVATDADAVEALTQQEHAIASMSRLLNALLDISKLESGAIKPEPADFTVAGLFEELRLEFGSLASHKGLRLDIEPAKAYVRSDPALVEQILRNIVSNAIKYTERGWVRLRCLQEAALVRIEVLDTGVGIATDHMPYICEEFYQIGVSTNSSREGYGLGLSIVQRIVKLLALKLDVNSEVGKGSTFALTLPASTAVVPSGDTTAVHSPILEPQVGSTRVLLVEDDAAVRSATRMLLKGEGYGVTAVASLAEALRHVRAGNGVDLLISDYHLADGETGTQVVAAIREFLAVPVKSVITTGDTSTAIKELPRDPLLRIASKPIRAEELLTLLRALLAA